LEMRRSPSTLAGASGLPPSGVATFGKGPLIATAIGPCKRLR